MHFRNLTLLVLSVSSAALAQTHFCIAGELDNLNTTQTAECKAKMANIREAVKRHGAPSGWHFVMVCDEGGWSDYANFIAPSGAELKEASFHTNGTQHWTFVRGSRVDADSAKQADTLLAIALEGVPSPKLALIPNPKRVLREPALSVASVEPSQLP